MRYKILPEAGSTSIIGNPVATLPHDVSNSMPVAQAHINGIENVAKITKVRIEHVVPITEDEYQNIISKSVIILSNDDVIAGLVDLIVDRQSFLDGNEEHDEIFKQDIAVLSKAIGLIKQSKGAN